MLSKLKNWYGALSPKYRMAMRSLVIGVLTYAAQDLSDGDIDDWEAIYTTLKVTVAYTVLGLLTPLEPFVGIGKPDRVEVPTPPATPET
jgi:hypothetical protein